MIAPDGSVLAITDDGESVFINGANLESISWESGGVAEEASFWVLTDVNNRKFLAVPYESGEEGLINTFDNSDGIGEITESGITVLDSIVEGYITIFNLTLRDDNNYFEFRQFELARFLAHLDIWPKNVNAALNCYLGNSITRIFIYGGENVSCLNGQLIIEENSNKLVDFDRFVYDCNYEATDTVVPGNMNGIVCPIYNSTSEFDNWCLFNAYNLVWFFGVPASVFPWMNDA